MRATALLHSESSGPGFDFDSEKGVPVYEGGSHEATAAQSPDSRRMAFWVEREGGLETESRMPPAKWAMLRAWVMDEGAEGG
jgi:hypothetical protein